MFNFSIFTKALTDNTLSKNEFRVLCLMLNTSSFKQSNTIEMYNGYIQDTLGISERNVRDITKSLELKDYIKKEVNTNSHNRNANRYTILGTEKCAEKCAENCPPNNLDIKYNKNNNNIKNINIKTSDDGTLHENNKIKNINIKTSEVTPGTGIFQDEKVNNDLKLNDMKKENEMSDNGTNAMNAISEQRERQARENESSESGTKNEMTTSTPGNKNNTSREIQNIPVDKSKVINNDCNVQGVIPNAKDCAPAPATEEWKPIAWDEDAIFGSEEPQNVSVDKLSTNDDKTCQNAQECPQIEFNRERMLRLMDMSAKETVLERFKEQLKEMDAYMQYLKMNDHFTYEIYLKEIWSWWNNPMNVWNSDFDFICVGNSFKRKYVA